MDERGVTQDEVVATVLHGEPFPAKHSRTGFRRNFSFDANWRGKRYSTKQIEALAVFEDGVWIVVTVIARYF